MLYFIFILVAGICSLAFGSLLLFSEKFLTYLENGIWKRNKKDKLFTKESARHYNKYVTGIEGVVMGLMFIGLALLYFFK